MKKPTLSALKDKATGENESNCTICGRLVFWSGLGVRGRDDTLLEFEHQDIVPVCTICSGFLYASVAYLKSLGVSDEELHKSHNMSAGIKRAHDNLFNKT